jgi:hypothetical protein
MSSTRSDTMEYEEIGDHWSTVKKSVTCTHNRSSDSVIFDFSDGRHMVFSDDEWAAMTKADDNAREK